MNSPERTPPDMIVRRWLLELARHACRGTRSAYFDADDVAQSVWLRYFRVFSQGEPHNQRGWLRTAVRMQVLDILRRESFKREHLDDSAIKELSDPNVDSQDPATEQRSRDANESMEREISQLPIPFREVMLLRHGHGWTRRQIETWLRTWRAIGPDEAHRIFRGARTMLERRWGKPSAGASTRSKRGKKKNPWETTPPPFERH